VNVDDDKNEPEPIKPQDNVQTEPEPEAEPELPEMGHLELRGRKPDDVKFK
jgi:hypothetical protein